MNSIFLIKNRVFLLVATSIFMSTLDSSIVNVALPYIMTDLKTHVQKIQWVVIIYLLTVSSFLLLFGRLSDITGRRKVYCTGFGIFTFGSLLCSLAQVPWFLILSRGIQGFGASMLMACSPALIVDAFPPKERGRAIGMVGAVVAGGLTAGPLAGGVLLDLFSWRTIFYINLPIGICATLSGILLLKDTSADQGSGEPLDIKGGLCLIIGLVSLILGLSHLDRWGVMSLNSLMMFLICCAAFTGFVMTEIREDYPLFDPKLFKIRLFTLPVINSSLLFCALFIIIFIMPFFLVHACGYSPSATGMIMTTPFMFLLVISPAAGALYDRVGSRFLCASGTAVVTLALVMLLGLGEDMAPWSIVWRLSLAGLGTAMFISPNNTAAMNAVPIHRRGIASGAVATSRNLGMVVGVSLAGLIFTSSFSSLTLGAGVENLTSQMIPAFMISFRRTMTAGIVICVINFGLVFLRGREHPLIPSTDNQPTGPGK